MSTWNAPHDPSCYGTLDLDCEIIDKFLENYNSKNPDAKITYTHFFMKLIGLGIEKAPDANGTIAFGQFVPFKGVNISTLVAVGKKNLTGVTVSNCQKLSLSEIRKKTNARIKKIKTDKDEDTNHQINTIKFIPAFIIECIIDITSFISYSLGIGFKFLRIKKYSFGNIILTNVSPLPFIDTFAPLVNFSEAFMVAVICKPKLRAIVGPNRKMEIRKMIKLNVTFDHRYADAANINSCLLYTSPSPRD